MKTCTLAVVLVVSIPAVTGEEIRVDSRVILNDLASLYRDAPRAEDMRVAVETTSEKRIERMTVMTDPGRGAEIRIGPVTLWTDLDAWYATHDDLPSAYTRVPIEGRTVVQTLDAHFPALIVPQIVWMTSEGHVDDLCAYTTETTWTTGTVFSPCSAMPNDIVSTATASGRAGDFDISVTMESTADQRDRLGVIRLESADGITILAQRFDYQGPADDDLGVPLEGRERVETFHALLARLPETGR